MINEFGVDILLSSVPIITNVGIDIFVSWLQMPLQLVAYQFFYRVAFIK
jgi:hypothetical protein